MKRTVSPRLLWDVMYGVAALAVVVTYLLICHDTFSLGGGILCIAVAEILLLAFFVGLRYANTKEITPEKLFLLLFIPLSLGMMVVLPIFRAPDEMSHVERAWQISVGEWIPTSKNQGIFYQPDNLMDGFEDSHEVTLWQVLNISDKQLSDTMEVAEVGTNTGVYPVNNYIPQAIGLFLMRLFTNNRVLILYGARIGAWVLTTILFFYAIKKIPSGKYTCMAITLFPMMLQEAASASADGLTCSAAFAFFAFILWARAEKPVLSAKDIVILFLLTHWVSSFKLMYAPLAFLIFLIPVESFGSRKRKIWLGSIILMVSLLFAISWLLLCKRLYIDTASSSTRLEGNIMRHINVILRQPFTFLTMILKTFAAEFLQYGSGMLGRGISWHNVFIPDILTALELVAILGIFVIDRRNLPIRLKKGGVAILSACIVSVIVMYMALFIWWTPYGSERISGIQGRYFLPLLPYVILLIKSRWSGYFQESGRRRLICFLAMICFCAVFSVFLQTVK